MKKLAFPLLLAFVLLISYAFFNNPAAFFTDIINTLEIWLFKVYPSIFTFYILASILVNTKLINVIIYLFRPLFRYLRFSDENSLYLFTISIFIGNPASASLICETLKKGQITKNQANNLLKYSAFLNPFFIISFLTALKLNYALIVIFVHVFANFLIVFFLNRKNPPTKIKAQKPTFSLGEILTSVQNVIHLLLLISGIMVLCNILRFSLLTVLDKMAVDNDFIKIILANIEISIGLNTVISSNLSLFLTLLLFSIFTSFAGISIHLQVYTVIKEEGLIYKNFFMYRILQAAIAACLFIILWLII